MTGPLTSPPADIAPETTDRSSETWSTATELDHGRSSVVDGGALRRARADALAEAVGGVDLDTMRDHHLALAMAVIELAADGGRPLPWSHDDPTVALLRATAKLAMTTPAASSSAAADLLDRLGADGIGSEPTA